MDIRTLTGATALSLLLASPSFALGSWFPHKGEKGGNGRPPVIHSAPGPIAAVGLPAAAALGGYVWYRSRKRRAKR